ncbi:MAG: hypothetical protein Q9168_007414 [Polycauliona sp. 1 TL-2023]
MADDPAISNLISKINVWSLRSKPSMPLTRPFQPGLGDFSPLPPEIRSKIWEEYFRVHSSTECTCIPFSKTGNPEDAAQGTRCNEHQIAILLTSKQLYHEAEAELYRHRHIRICFNCFHAEHSSAPPPNGTTFYTTIDGVCVPRNFVNADFSRFESVSLLVHLPPDTDLSKVHPPPKTILDDYHQNATILEVRRFCQLVQWCQWSKPSHYDAWPVFDVTVQLDQSAVPNPDSDNGALRIILSHTSTHSLMEEMAAIRTINLETTVITINLKVRLTVESVREQLRHKAEREKRGLPVRDFGKAGDGKGNSATVHACLQSCEHAAGVPVFDCRMHFSVKYVSDGEGLAGKEYDWKRVQ